MMQIVDNCTRWIKGARIPNPRHIKKTIIIDSGVNEKIQVSSVIYKTENGYFKCLDNRYKEFWNKLAYENIASLIIPSTYKYLIIPHSEPRIAHIDSIKKVGIFQDKARGESIWNIPCKEWIDRFTPSFEHALSVLRIVDFICCELDHSIDNFYVIKNEEGNFIGICPFDNGGVGSFPMTNSYQLSTYEGCDPLLNKGKLSFPYVDKDLAYSIMNIHYKDVWNAVVNYIGPICTIALWERVVCLRTILGGVILTSLWMLINGVCKYWNRI